MNRRILLAATALACTGLSLAGCATTPPVAATPTPPAPPVAAVAPAAPAIPVATGIFAEPSTLPYQAPPFDRIRDEDYLPGFEQAIAIKRAEVMAIASDPAAPTFANTIIALERSGQMLGRVARAFSARQGSNTNPMLDATQSKVSPLLAALDNDIMLNTALFARIRALYEARATLGLDAEQSRVLELYHDDFVRAGAQLDAPAKAQLAELNTRLSVLQTAFGQKLTAATREKAVVFDRASQLAGLSPAEVSAAADAAKARGLAGKWVIALQNTTQQPALEAMTDRAARQALFEAGWGRAESGGANDTRALIAQIAALRAEQAKLMGYPNYAAYHLGDQMAKTPEAALAFMTSLAGPTAAAERRDAAELDAVIRAKGGRSTVRPWDWDHYAAEVRRTRYGLDEAQTKPFFEARTVLEKGVFYAANKMYGITFKRRDDLPVWGPDVWVYELFEETGEPLGLAYFDYFKRDAKRGGAWMSTLVDSAGLFGTKPIITNTANLAAPAPGQPALLTPDEVRTMFHEFGHGLHGLFARGTYPRVTGTTSARDFVEFPSQFNEHWAYEPSVLANYARHWQTGAPLPAPLARKIIAAEKFNQAYATGEALAAAMLDMSWHTAGVGQTPTDAAAFEPQALKATGLATDLVPPRYRSTYFRHVFAGGYAASYYAYLWTDMLDEDAYQWFREHGGMTRANGQRLRDMVLSRGDSIDYGPMYRGFAGRDPGVDAMLRSRGLKP